MGLDNATGLSFPDYKIISAAYGIDYFKINSQKETKENLEIILNNKRPVICEVVLDKNINYQPKVSSKKDSNGKIVSANLYDMSPFLDKDELEKILSIKK